MTTNPTLSARADYVIPEWELCDRMRRTLRASSLTVTDVADVLGVRREAVSTWINGHRRPSRAVLIWWAERFAVPLEWLETGQAPTVTSGPDTELPRLDSNQQPSGYPFSLVRGSGEVVHLAAERAWRRAS